jgi:protoporphyrinogen oxidase
LPTIGIEVREPAGVRWRQSLTLSALPGLHLAGNAYGGIGIPDCVRSGKQAAEKIAGQKSGG